MPPMMSAMTTTGTLTATAMTVVCEFDSAALEDSVDVEDGVVAKLAVELAAG